jgi:WD40 repeat protein
MKISISRSGQEIGEWPEGEIREFYREGRLVDTDLYWKQGMTEWAPLARLIRPPPPFPTPPQKSSPTGFAPMPAPVPPPKPSVWKKIRKSLGAPDEKLSVKLHNHNVKCLTLSPSESRLLFLCGKSFCAWDLSSASYQTLVETLEDPSGYTEFFKLRVLPDDSRVLLIGRNGRLFCLDEENKGITRLGDLIVPPEGEISCFKISPNGRYAVVCAFTRFTMHGHKDVHLRLWDLQTLTPVMELVGHKNPVWDVHFSRDGSQLITCSGFVGDHGFFGCESPRYRMWTLDDGVCVNSFGGTKRSVLGKEESEPGDELSSGCLDVSPDWHHGLFSDKKNLKVVDLKTWKTIKQFDDLSAEIVQARFLNNGDYAYPVDATWGLRACSGLWPELNSPRT